MRTSNGLLVRQEVPYNAAPDAAALVETFITPNTRAFVRSHGPVPQIDPLTYRLYVTGLVNKTFELSLDALKTQFPKVQILATLQCAGNRRTELEEVAPMPGELAWRNGALANCIWGGVRLCDVLEAVGVQPSAAHVALEGYDRIQRDTQTLSFGGSIPLEKALGPEVLLAYEMNGEPLTAEHGFPVRLVVPGYVGARSIKWLASLTLQAEPSSNFYQANSYKLFGPEVQASSADWSQGQMLGDLVVNSAICYPTTETKVVAGTVTVRGYAIAGKGCHVQQVELSCDGGATWLDATLQASQKWAWTLWEKPIELYVGVHELVVRAWDSENNLQPQHLEQVWNFKGYMNNAWHRYTIEVI